MVESRKPIEQKQSVAPFRQDTTAGELARSEARFRLLVEAVEDLCARHARCPRLRAVLEPWRRASERL